MSRKTINIEFPAAGVARHLGLRVAAGGGGPLPAPWATKCLCFAGLAGNGQRTLDGPSSAKSVLKSLVRHPQLFCPVCYAQSCFVKCDEGRSAGVSQIL